MQLTLEQQTENARRLYIEYLDIRNHVFDGRNQSTEFDYDWARETLDIAKNAYLTAMSYIE